MEDFEGSVRCLEHSPEYWENIPDDRYELPISSSSFTDESGKLFIGRFFTKEEIVEWLKHQPKPTWVKHICIHHTWSPTPENWYGLKTLYGVFDYYQYERKWPKGKGPHGWVAPEFKGGSWGAFIGTNPFFKGIGDSST